MNMLETSAKLAAMINTSEINTSETAPLDRDAGRDSAHHCAAVAIFGFVGVASVAVTFGWLAMRGGEPAWPESISLAPAAAASVSMDLPMLRAGSTDGGASQFTLTDGETRDVVTVQSPVESSVTR